MNRQIPLPLAHERDLAAAPFVVSPSNAQALQRLEAPGSWPGGVLAVIGPKGSGKSHVARRWAAQTDATALSANDMSDEIMSGAVLIDDANNWADSEGLFHLINRAATGEINLLLTGRTAPASWETPLPDLRSRLNAIEVVALLEPDDEVLKAVLEAQFEARGIRPSKDLIPYLMPRMERSYAAAARVAAVLDEAGRERRREINRALAVEALAVESVINDLFDDTV